MLRYYIGIPIAVLVLGVSYYGISPLFRNIILNDPYPSSTIIESTVPAPVVGTAGHPASGTARIIDAEGRSYLRYESFKTINGPDLYIYLAKTPDAKDFVNLGLIKATEGNVNYEIPAGINAIEYPYALVWCKAFGVLFNFAKLY